MLERSKIENMRKIKIPGAGLKPEDTRAGRPALLTVAERIAKAARSDKGLNDARRKAQEEAQRRKTEGYVGYLPRTPRFGNHIIGDDPISKPPKEPENEKGLWSLLRRRQEPPVQSPNAPPRDVFAEDRARREEQSRAGRYTPVGNRPLFNSTREDVDSQNQSTNPNFGSMRRSKRFELERNPAQPKDAPKIDTSWLRDTPQSQREGNGRGSDDGVRARSGGSESSFTITRSITEAPSNFQTTVKYEPLRDERERQRTSEPDRPRFQAQEQKERAESQRSRYEFETPVELSERKRPSRFTESKPSYEAAPRGKARDKAKRRQNFIQEGEEEDDQDLEEARKRALIRKQRKAAKAAKKAATPTPILLPEYISVSNLAVALKIRYEDFIEKLEELGYEETRPDYILSSEDSGLIAMEFNYEAIIDRGDSEDLKAREPAKDPSALPQRPPVVTIMGHVDHGKTTLLDYLRKSSVAATEHGGITQHIGAFSVPMPSGKTITFLDTPGHAAFLSMRQRGANVTDIVILVVAADDSVKPQTIEAINHAKAAKVPIIVAINKIDKENSNIDRVKQDLARHGVDVEDFGGDTQVVCVSGKTGQGMEELEEAAVTLSEILDMRSEVDGQAEGWVLEASVKSMGKVATVLVRRGTMRPGDFIVAGKTWARIRCLRNEAGVEILEAGPGTPVEVDGWREQPLAGDEVLQAPDEAKAKSVVDYRLEKEERDKMAEDMEAINTSRKFEQDKREREKEEARLAALAKEADEAAPEKQAAKAAGPKQIYFIVKGDVSGSVEAVLDSIAVLGNKEVQPHILRSGVGQLSEFDIEHAAAAKGHLINFNTAVEPNISRLAEEAKVSILDHNIIYRLVDDVKAELSKHLPPLVTQRVLGEAEIAQIFEITVKGRQQKNIAGCKVRNGSVFRNAKVRVLRNNKKIFDGMFPPFPPLPPQISFFSGGSTVTRGRADCKNRYSRKSQECEEGCARDEERHRMWHGL